MSFNYITGIDPGTTETGVVIINFEATKIEYCCKIDNNIFITLLDTEALPLLRNSHVGIETVMTSWSKVGNELFKAIRWEGKFQHAIKVYTGSYPAEINRKHVFGAVLHDNCGNDERIRIELTKRYGKPFMKELNSTDTRAALAVALTLKEDILLKRNSK
jgi:hypothetical protein